MTTGRRRNDLGEKVTLQRHVRTIGLGGNGL
jgi:hypothetical protein